MKTKSIITTKKAPNPIGPYSVGIEIDNFIFTAGQIGLDPKTNELVKGGIEAETRQVLTNISGILESRNCSMDNVIKTTVFLRDMNDFPKMNGIYSEFFVSDFPARSTVQVAALPKGAAIEIEVIAFNYQ